MKLRLIIFSSLAAASVLMAACGGTTSNTNSNVNHSNSMTNLGTNNANSNIYVTNSNSNSSKWNSNISREDYEKNRSEYEKNKGSDESVGQSLEDSWLWFKAKSALATTSDLRDSTINVDVQNGVITLKGTVGTAAEKTKAKQVADGIDGKKSVVDQLKVAPNDSMTNTSSGNSNSHSNTNKK